MSVQNRTVVKQLGIKPGAERPRGTGREKFGSRSLSSGATFGVGGSAIAPAGPDLP